MNLSSPDTSVRHVPAIGYEEFLSRRGNARIVDVLPWSSYQAGHIGGAISLPVDDIPQRAKAVLPDLHEPIIVYCGGPT